MTRSRSGALSVATVLIVALWGGVSSERTAAQERVKAEVRAAWDEYVRAVSQKRADVIATQVYLAPSFSLGPMGVVLSMTAADTQSRFESTIDALTRENYERSETQSANVCILNDTAAILSARFVRYRKDGSILSEPAGTYVFAKTNGGWRIVVQISHAPDRVVACGV